MTDLKREACLINGAWETGASWIEVDNPATGEIVGRIPSFGQAETARAINAAAAAMPAWAALTAEARGAVLHRLAALMIERKEDLAQLLTAEQGKPLAEARAEIAYAASFFTWFAEEARRAYGEIIPSPNANSRIAVLRQPVGVLAAITPWNFPSAMITRKIAPALAAGCAVVVKPSELTPFSAMALGVLAEEAGLPPGLLNIITGDAIAIGGELTGSRTVRKLSFTGSTRVGTLLYAQCAPTVKKLSLELGGNAPFIVFDDADLDSAIEGAIASKFRNAGQTCVCANRLYVQRPVYDRFVEVLAARTGQLVVGDGRVDGSDIGPLINMAAVEKVRVHISDAVAKGARIVTGGAPNADGGQYVRPTVLANVDSTMLVTQEETFGPLAPVIPFDTEDELIAMANATEFGLAAYFYARDIGRIWRVAERIEAGMIGVNTGIISTEVAPFGGVKASGLGREGSHYGLDDYMELKYLALGLS